MFTLVAGPIEVPRCPSVWRIATIFVATFFILNFFGTTNIYAATNAVTWPPIGLKPVASGFSNPIDVVSPNDGTDRLFVLERGGLIYIIENGIRLEEPFLNISDRVSTCSECGLLGLAFPPNFAANGYFFINYTSKTDLVPPDTGDGDTDSNGDTVIARFHITANPNVADSADEDQLLVINQPDINHNGGHILFGPDNYLYIGMGDGGGNGSGNPQDPASLHGKLLRIEVGGTLTYTIPASNPFTTTLDYRPEIWATGLRNPWRYNFDTVTGDLYVADVGQGTFEEVNHIAAADIGDGGMNFGWRMMEGDVCFPPSGPQTCDRTGLTLPVTTYNHDLGDCSVTGGFVYAAPLPGQEPVYLYGDYCTGRVWGLQPDGPNWVTSELEDFPFQIPSFGQEANGKTYLVSYGGTIYALDDSITGLTADNDGPTVVNTPISFSASHTAITGGSDITYTWEYGDGSTSMGITTTHTYTQSGVYTASVTATNATTSTMASTTVYVGDAVVDVTSNQYVPRNITIPPGGNVVWVLGNGSHSVTADDNSFEQPLGNDWSPFVQTFASAASAEATVVAYHCTLHGGIGGVGMAGSVTVEAPEPITGLNASNDGPTEINSTTSFSTTISSGAGSSGTGIAYAWEFGDGNNGVGITTTHTYTQSGIYTATVVASNAISNVTATTTVYVGDAVVDVRNNSFDPSEVTIFEGGKVVWVLREGFHSVTADDSSFEQPAASDWSPFMQTFPTQGVVPYHCTVHNGMAGSVIVQAPPPPVEGLTATNDGPTQVNTPTSLSASITAGTGISYTWNFGDGSSGSGITTTHSYTQSGIYTPTVTATNATNSLIAATTVYVGDAVVDVVNNSFDPRDVTIPQGGKVVWVLREGIHSVTADVDGFEQPAASDWPPFVQTFPTQGVVPYYCNVHGAAGGIGMAGSVTVGPPSTGDENELHLPTIRRNTE